MSQTAPLNTTAGARGRAHAPSSTNAVESVNTPSAVLDSQPDEVSLEQLSPLERLREARRRARATDDAHNQDDPT